MSEFRWKKASEMSPGQLIDGILVLAKEKEWTDDKECDLKWRQMLGSLSQEVLAFWFNRVRDTTKENEGRVTWRSYSQCYICKKDYSTSYHILCYTCEPARKRLTWRHNAVLKKIHQAILKSKEKESAVTVDGAFPWGEAGDWKISIDKRMPKEIVDSKLRPDISIYSLKARVVNILELTCPFEDNRADRESGKTHKYEELVEAIQKNGYDPHFMTIEVGALGFVLWSTMEAFDQFGLKSEEKEELRRELSKTAIECSYYIWKIYWSRGKWEPPEI